MIILDIDTKMRYEINPTKNSGEVYMTCPVCSESRKKKKDKCFSWNADLNVGFCQHCNRKFCKDDALRKVPEKVYSVPEWKNKTELTDKAVHWFTGRMISQDTLNALKVYSDREWMPQYDKEVDVMCFPYFVDGQLKNIKYRGPQKSFRMVKDAELVFWGLDEIKDLKEIGICEGEIDRLTFWDCGFKNFISVPNGASGNDLVYLDNYIGRLDKVEKIYIATDFDEPGLKLRNELIRRLGSERCVIVSYDGYKDANELLCAKGGMAVQEAVKTAKESPIDGIVNLDNEEDDFYSLLHYGIPEGNRIGIDALDEHIRWETGRLAVCVGIPGHGKSEAIDFIVNRLNILYGWKAAYFSPENYPIKMHYAKVVEKLVGVKYDKDKLSEMNYENSLQYIKNNFWWLDPNKDSTIDGILSRAEKLIKTKGIKQLVIDPFNTLEHKRDKNETQTDYIGRFLDMLVGFARKHDIIIFLICHPVKPEKLSTGVYPPPTLYDVAGSANFYNKADYGLTVYRNFSEQIVEFYVTKVKFKNLGQARSEGIPFKYNINNGRYSAWINDNTDYDNSNWLNFEPKQIEITNYYEPKEYEDDESTPF